MSWQSWLLAGLIVLAATLQYGLMAVTLRDLRARPTVRGGNKVAWGLAILALPFAGAVAYAFFGPMGSGGGAQRGKDAVQNVSVTPFADGMTPFQDGDGDWETR